jgi:hypothetical protein
MKTSATFSSLFLILLAPVVVIGQSLDTRELTGTFSDTQFVTDVPLVKFPHYRDHTNTISLQLMTTLRRQTISSFANQLYLNSSQENLAEALNGFISASSDKFQSLRGEKVTDDYSRSKITLPGASFCRIFTDLEHADCLIANVEEQSDGEEALNSFKDAVADALPSDWKITEKKSKSTLVIKQFWVEKKDAPCSMRIVFQKNARGEGKFSVWISFWPED